jgi:hypothetical protein
MDYFFLIADHFTGRRAAISGKAHRQFDLIAGPHASDLFFGSVRRILHIRL